MHLKSTDQKEFKFIFFVILIFSLSGCKNDAQINFYNKKLKKNKLKCLKFIPQKNDKLENALSKLYKFDKSCPNILTLSYKSDIKCNSRFNTPQKTTSNFPNAYLTLEVRTGFNPQYSYYIDLTSKPTKSDIEDAFDRLKEDILE